MFKSFRVFLKSVIAVLMSACVLIAIGYFYIESNLRKTVDTKPENIPYYREEAEPVTVLFEVAKHKTLIYFNFSEGETWIVFSAMQDEDMTAYGYDITYTVKCSYEVVGGIVDALDGIDLTDGGNVVNCTGAQVVHRLKTSLDYEALRRLVVKKILEKISKKGFALKDMLYIIENSETQLTVPDCYDFSSDFIKAFSNINFVN